MAETVHVIPVEGFPHREAPDCLCVPEMYHRHKIRVFLHSALLEDDPVFEEHRSGSPGPELHRIADDLA
jgi:hypothetical protein